MQGVSPASTWQWLCRDANGVGLDVLCLLNLKNVGAFEKNESRAYFTFGNERVTAVAWSSEGARIVRRRPSARPPA